MIVCFQGTEPFKSKWKIVVHPQGDAQQQNERRRVGECLCICALLRCLTCDPSNPLLVDRREEDMAQFCELEVCLRGHALRAIARPTEHVARVRAAQKQRGGNVRGTTARAQQRQ